MNRYYCKNCGSEAIKGDNARRSDAFVVYCPMCEDENGNEVKMAELPDYETPEQYEKRTGKKWNGAAFYRCINESCEYYSGFVDWEVGYSRSFDLDFDETCSDCRHIKVICAQSPEPPTYDWKPEE